MKKLLLLGPLALVAFVALMGAVSLNTSYFDSISVTSTNFMGEGVVTNGLTLGGVRETSWPSGGSTNLTDSGTNVLAKGSVKGDSSTWTNGLTAGASTFTSTVDATGAIIGRKGFEEWSSTLTHAGTTTLDFNAAIRDVSMSLTGNVTLATSNLATNRVYKILLQNAQATNCTITVPADWRVPGGRPSTIAAGRWGLWSLKSYGTTDTNVLACYAEEM